MYLTSAGMVCPVGLSASAACAAMRAGVAMFEELSYRDNMREPVVGAMVASLDIQLEPGLRLTELLSTAIADCLPEEVAEPLDSVPLLVGLAETDRPGGQASLADSIIGDVERKLGVRFHPDRSCTIARGHVSGFVALRKAREMLKDSAIPACLLCGVDSYLNASSLSWLDQQWRLKTSDNSDGVIPGEAAAAIYVRRQPTSATGTVVEVIGLGAARESATVLSEEPLLGLGLTDAARAALAEAKLEMHEIDFRLSDVTGESYGFKEQALALSRLMRARREELPIWHSADCIGDCGAAAGVGQLVIARESFIKDYAPGDHAACYTSSVPGDRAVTVLRRQRI
ncbi:MAG: 3-oxoacyl-ACP synthase [Planctomycetes bacterium]|nr:3-oxoacyl-ACP synthase [Planctomycetota bacterium]